jgi:hypothetical protein
MKATTNTYKMPGPYSPISSVEDSADPCPSCSALRARIVLLEGVAKAAKKVDAAKTAQSLNPDVMFGWALVGLHDTLAALEGREGK